jgi:hypothetical protein
MSWWHPGLLALSIAGFAVSAGIGAAHAVERGGAVRSTAAWATNGPVDALAVRGKTLYVGGRFSQIGPPTGGLVAFSASTAARLETFPAVEGGGVESVVSDGANGWFVGGSFATIGGVACPNLAHVRSSMAVDTAFCPRPDGTVWAISLTGSRLYVGGWFGRIGGQARTGLAALDPASGSPLPWAPQLTGHIYSDATGGPAVYAVAPSGSRIYVAGDFARVGGKARDGVAALDAETAAPLAWAPEVGWDHEGWGFQQLVVTSTRVYGQCRCSIGRLTREQGLFALDAQTGAPLLWNPQADGIALALALSGETLYVGGDFTKIAGVARRGLAAFDAATGALSAWSPKPLGQAVSAVSIAGSTVYAASRSGNTGVPFTSEIEAFDSRSGATASWRPERTNGGVATLAVGGDDVAAGGGFTGVGGYDRDNLAAIDLRTGAATPWHPVVAGADYGVEALALSGGSVFLGGDFTRVNGKRRRLLAAVDAVTGATTAWAPAAGGGMFSDVKALAVAGGTVYFGGDKVDVTAVDARTGRRSGGPRLRWGIGEIDAIEVAGRSYVIGGENAVGVFARSTGVRAFEPATLDYSVFAVELVKGTVYAGGNFSSLQGRNRPRLGALDARTGALLPWNPRPDWNVQALRRCGTQLYVGGLFDRIAGARRAGLAAFDLRTGRLSQWAPVFPAGQGLVSALTCTGSLVYAGGEGGVTAYAR